MRLLGKIFITGQIEALTGLRIGGSKTSLDIGGIDLNVIKDPQGIPFIPGSSLKGKLRSILAREEGSEDVKTDSDCMQNIFGESPSKGIKGQITRLIVRDCNLLNAENLLKNKKLELDYTESKWETAIDRKTGAAKSGSLRQIERVPAGAIFDFELVYNVFSDNKTQEHLQKILEAMSILEDDYLGGCGSRGYGKVEFNGVKVEAKSIENYSKAESRKSLEELKDIFQLSENDNKKIQELINYFSKKAKEQVTA